MSSYRFDSYVNRQEADALKEMIFKRARERAEAMSNDINTSYTDSAHNDVMNLARESFNATKNPFSLGADAKETNPTPAKTEQTEQIGFAPRKSDSVKPAVSNSDRVVKETIVNNTLQSNMNDARNDFKTNKSFMGALEFLNSQASIALIQNRGKKFEALA